MTIDEGIFSAMMSLIFGALFVGAGSEKLLFHVFLPINLRLESNLREITPSYNELGRMGLSKMVERFERSVSLKPLFMD